MPSCHTSRTKAAAAAEAASQVTLQNKGRIRPVCCGEPKPTQRKTNTRPGPPLRIYPIPRKDVAAVYISCGLPVLCYVYLFPLPLPPWHRNSEQTKADKKWIPKKNYRCGRFGPHSLEKEKKKKKTKQNGLKHHYYIGVGYLPPPPLGGPRAFAGGTLLGPIPDPPRPLNPPLPLPLGPKPGNENSGFPDKRTSCCLGGPPRCIPGGGLQFGFTPRWLTDVK